MRRSNIITAAVLNAANYALSQMRENEVKVYPKTTVYVSKIETAPKAIKFQPIASTSEAYTTALDSGRQLIKDKSAYFMLHFGFGVGITKDGTTDFYSHADALAFDIEKVAKIKNVFRNSNVNIEVEKEVLISDHSTAKYEFVPDGTVTAITDGEGADAKTIYYKPMVNAEDLLQPLEKNVFIPSSGLGLITFSPNQEEAHSETGGVSYNYVITTAGLELQNAEKWTKEQRQTFLKHFYAYHNNSK